MASSAPRLKAVIKGLDELEEMDDLEEIDGFANASHRSVHSVGQVSIPRTEGGLGMDTLESRAHGGTATASSSGS